MRGKGCLTCRKRKVKCDEAKPICGRCHRLQRECVWSDELQVAPQRRYSGDGSSTIAIVNGSKTPAIQVSNFAGQNFVIEFPGIEKATIPYIHHFVTFCCRFLAYPNDSEGNPFQEELVPLATSSPALMHSMTALAAAHLSRSQRQHEMTAAHHYSLALRELNNTLSDPDQARSDSTLGACLLLCVYEISHSDNCLWLEHLQGARDLILYRGGPKTSDYLTRFFSLLDVSGSLSSGAGPLLQGNYWIDDGLGGSSSIDPKLLRWPYYDSDNVMVSHFHELMIYMAKLSRLSSEAMSDLGRQRPELIVQKAAQIEEELRTWWGRCPPALRDQSNDWRRLPRQRKLTVAETLEEEAFSSTKSCMCGCIIYLNHILDPIGQEPQKPEVLEAINQILEIAKETPEGYGLEMGLYWGLFMAGVAIFNDLMAEDLIRRKLKSDTSVSIYHADRALELLEVLWKRQHQYAAKYDWRQVQIQMGIQVVTYYLKPSQRKLGSFKLREVREIPTMSTIIGSNASELTSTGINQQPILLLGATGKVASRIVPLLSSAGYPTLLASRSGKFPSDLPSCMGVKFDWEDESTYAGLFDGKGARAVYLIAPPKLDCFEDMKKLIDLGIKKGVKRWVLQSASVVEVGDGPVMGKVSGYIQSLEGSGIEWAVLRPTWFMENFSEQQHLPTIRARPGTIISATGTGKIPFVSVDDIAAVAFHALTSSTPPNADYLILGPELWSYDDVAQMLTKKLGREVSHVNISEAQLAEGMAGFGIAPEYARMLAELDTYIKEGKEANLNGDVEKVTGRQPKKLETFLDECIAKGVWS
ncbi:fungal-specific transcription factor domain-containing protein [Tricladium varicosporioides]|nr:fungal-specific transcription factor domain-containing protein [Hymenoscyphus varicosporioides]